jgi:cytochrome c peroxidase
MRVLLASLLLALPASAAGTLHVEFQPRFGKVPLAFDTLAFETEAGQRVSVSRCDFLLSGASLKKADGEWIGLPSWSAFLSMGAGRNAFALKGVPEGRYSALRFHVGLPPEMNNADASAHPPDHPLNPLVNGLHWSWLGGYVFLALEGNWKDPGGSVRGYSHHLASDRLLMTVELPVSLDLAQDMQIKLALDVRAIFGGLKMTEAAATTHSREDDSIAADLKRNVENAFSLMSAAPVPREGAASASGKTVLLNPKATLRPFVVPRGFPRPSLPGDNPMTEEGIALGRLLFHDTRLSINGSQTCASCHREDAAFSDPRRFSLGAEGQEGTRNAMALVNLAWKREMFWDGRAPSLRAQVLMPIENPIEMHETLANVTAKLARDTALADAFAAAFGTREIDSDRIARALEQFLLTLVSGASKFDRVMAGGGAFTTEEQRGFELFHTENDPRLGQRGADCFHCHGGATFQNIAFANNGMDGHFRDEGRASVTKREGDKGKFAVPSLRNVALTAPYMHDGRFATLEEVIEHYDSGLKRSATLDPNLAKHPASGMGLSADEKRSLLAFLKTLTEEKPGPGTRRE